MSSPGRTQADVPKESQGSGGKTGGQQLGPGSNMPKVELIAKLYNPLEALATKELTVEMLVNRAVDEYVKAKMGEPPKGPGLRFS